MAEALVFPIFPLDGVILVPGGMLPLHVFEPRYRAMLADALAGDRRIAMALPLPGHSVESAERPPVHAVVGLGVVVHHEPCGDGRSNIVLHGQRRARIVEELDTGHPYRVVRGVPMEDVYPGDDDLRARALGLLDRIEGLEDDDRKRLETLTPGRIADAVLAPMPLPVQDKQSIQARAEVALRLGRLEVLLDLLQGSRYRPEMDAEDPRLN